MNIKTAVLDLKKHRNYADWKLLFFLVFFLDVKIAVKIAAIIIIYLLQFDFRFGFSFRNSRIPLFYPLIIAIAMIDYFINGSFSSHNYIVLLFTGIGFWLMCILAIHQIKLSVEASDPVVLHRTLIIFFLINALISLFNLTAIICETHVINPYTYQGQYQKYFISTGDYIKGISFDTSTTNAVLNALGIFYFLDKKNPAMLLVCTVILLFTGSNFINILVLFILAALFIFKSSKDQKSLIVTFLMLLIVFMAKVSPQNYDYVIDTFRNILHKKNALQIPVNKPFVRITDRPDSTLTGEEKKEKTATRYLDSVGLEIVKRRKGFTQPFDKNVLIVDGGKIIIPKPDINSAPYQSLVTTPVLQLTLVEFINTHKAVLPVSGQPDQWTSTPGKVIGIEQTLHFLKNHPAKVITGDGMGNFSSKLAFKTTALGITGSYPAKYAYINNDFLVNHLDLYLNFFSKRAGLHSLTNSPFSVYDQLLAEYGIIGFLAFLIFYWWYFAKHFKLITYGLPILVLVTAILFIDYWFEQLSVLILFELIMLLNIKESSVKKELNYAS